MGDAELSVRFEELRKRFPADFTPQVAVRCPFCEEKTRAIFVAGEDETGPAILHEMPFCPEFEELEIDAFLIRVRSRLSGSS
jgi:hypothetical protein